VKRWVKFEGLGRRLVISGLVLALALGVLVSLAASSSSVPSGISTVGYKTHYGPQPQTTSLSTFLSADDQSAGDISVPTGTAVSDSATLRGPNVYIAGGTVTYSVFSNRHCDSWAWVISGGTVNVIAGRVRRSERVTLYDRGTYYWQASYSGDAFNAASKSSCGSEQETVTKRFHHR